MPFALRFESLAGPSRIATRIVVGVPGGINTKVSVATTDGIPDQLQITTLRLLKRGHAPAGTNGAYSGDQYQGIAETIV